jgi:hypothetical protein
MRKILAVATICLAAMLGLTACGSAASTLVDYRRSGGIAGFDDQLTVATSGECVLSRRGVESRFSLSGEALNGLKRVLEGSGFSRLNDEYRPSQPGADLFSYEVAFGGKTVKATDGAVPDPLRSVIEALDEIVAAHSTP